MNPQIAVHRHEVQMAGLPSQRAKSPQNWHALNASVVIRLLEVNPNAGLTSPDVMTRRLKFGLNSCERVGSRQNTETLVLLCLSSAIGFLLTATILNSGVRDNGEAFSILVVVLIGAVLGFVHVVRAARARDAMQYATQANVRVRRAGQESQIKAEELVPGDIVILSAGDCVPADARLIEAEQLKVQESALSWKSSATSEKRSSAVATEAPLAQRQSMVYLGSTVLSGFALAVVVATGAQTELAKRASCNH